MEKPRETRSVSGVNYRKEADQARSETWRTLAKLRPGEGLDRCKGNEKKNGMKAKGGLSIVTTLENPIR
jgi:hypothetical protein